MADPIVYDVRSPDYLDEAAVEKELRRVFDACAGCRRCLPLCPAFPDLFQRIDTNATEDVEGLTRLDLRATVDLCYQCKLCYNHCPYHPPHRWMIDFPRLMLRARAARAKKEGVTLQDRILGMADLVGRLGSWLAPLSNWANKVRLNRVLMESVLGIHRDRNLPEYHRTTFSRWFRRRRAAGAGAAPSAKAALFVTCSVEYNEPSIGRAAVEVLERNGIDVSLPDQRCCGMPLLDGGDLEAATDLARRNVASLSRAVREGRDIVVPGPTCSYTLKQEYPHMLGTEEARQVASRTYDVCEYLMLRHKEGKLDTRFESPVGKVAYHLPCHLKAQNIGYKSRDLLALLPGTQVEMADHCSGVDGTWGFKKQYFDLSLKVAAPLIQRIESVRPDVTASDCPLACMQIRKGRGGDRPLHPIEIVRKAYGGGGEE
ncbi:MAG TPA: anaerobic glycerol-3-phosphate dehydrogenase subunit C [Candidatus Polarisedimenticolia bacterium]|nr:anaerobic glycerol-3-phosphate dehydrogenase subunit C [Candidatus Polarisedimenticolia bacterium]